MNITFEFLFEAWSVEKSEVELQKQDPLFYEQCKEYLLEKKQSDSDMFLKARKLYERIVYVRQKKVVTLAQMKARTGSNLIDTSAILDQEKDIFTNIVFTLTEKKSNRLFNELYF